MLLPREHGAYGQLLFPLVSAVLIGHPAAGAYLLAASAVSAFVAHESLLIVLGQRGSRASRDKSRDARRSLALFGAFCAVTGGVSLAVMPRDALLFMLVPFVLGVLLLMMVFAHRERSTAGETLAALALVSVSLPVALAGDVSRTSAFTLFAVFAAVFVAATLSVRAMIGRGSRGDGPPSWLAGVITLAVLAGLALGAVSGRLAHVAPYAALPVCAIALGLAARPPEPRYLRAIGWTLVGATAVTTVVLVTALA